MTEVPPPTSPSVSAAGRADLTSRSTESRGVREPVRGPAPRGSDQVEVSNMARLLSKLQSLPDVRTELVDRVRTEIDSGSYETPEKVDAAIDRMMTELSEEGF